MDGMPHVVWRSGALRCCFDIYSGHVTGCFGGYTRMGGRVCLFHSIYEVHGIIYHSTEIQHGSLGLS